MSGLEPFVEKALPGRRTRDVLADGWRQKRDAQADLLRQVRRRKTELEEKKLRLADAPLCKRTKQEDYGIVVSGP